MVRKAVFSRDDVIAAGISVVGKEGLTQLSARRVAEEMKASTAPVYSNFEKMDDLEIAIKQEAINLLISKIDECGGEDEFLGIGIGFLRFARSEPRLYSALFLEPNENYNPGPKLMEHLLAIMESHPTLVSLQKIERLLLLKKMGIFTNGLASHICTGRADDHSQEELEQLLEEVGEAVTKDAFSRPPRTEEEIERMSSFCPECLDNLQGEQLPEKDED